MSDTEGDKLDTVDAEDDLFGGQEEVEEEETRSKSNDIGVEASEDDENQDDEEENEEENDYSKPSKVLDISLPRHALTAEFEEDAYSLKLPVFLNIETHPFEASEFKDKISRSAKERSEASLTSKEAKDELVVEKLLNENTIRWRYSNSGNDEIIKQSNAHFIQWDDGSLSLKVGNEILDFKHSPLFDHYLVRSHEDLGILQYDTSLTKSANLTPASTLTSTHRKLTQAVKSIQRKDKILNTITNDDPLLKQRIADENEKRSQKLRRQLESKRRQQEERSGRSHSPSNGDGRYHEPSYERFARTYGEDEYDDEDDFIAGDDEVEEGGEDDEEEESGEEEESEKGAERLRRLKEEGAAKYEVQNAPDSTEENADEADDSKNSRKRRRILDSEDEEEQ